ncbi:hypothetical protein EDB80DRAFT_595838 [Ilyonectria destructans]|nr:hypothetical protein EDB80DRAFT_595838 [Ilyonectria destructans]
MSFPGFKYLVGVASGLPNMPLDIRLGDVLVSMPKGESRGLIAYDLGKKTGQDWVRLFPPLARTETIVASAIGSIKLDRKDTFLAYYGHIKDKEHPNGTFIDPGQEHDALYQIDSGGAKCLVGRERRPDSKRTRVWYGPIGSGEDLTKNAQKRNELRDEHNIIGLEMGAAEVMDCIPVGVIRGVCNYGDEHNNDKWKPYAAAMAAAYAKAILDEIGPRRR